MEPSLFPAQVREFEFKLFLEYGAIERFMVANEHVTIVSWAFFRQEEEASLSQFPRFHRKREVGLVTPLVSSQGSSTQNGSTGVDQIPWSVREDFTIWSTENQSYALMTRASRFSPSMVSSPTPTYFGGSSCFCCFQYVLFFHNDINC